MQQMNLRRSNRILDWASSSIRRFGHDDITDTVSSKACFIQNATRTNASYVQSEDPRFQHKSSGHYKSVRPYSVQQKPKDRATQTSQKEGMNSGAPEG